MTGRIVTSLIGIVVIAVIGLLVYGVATSGPIYDEVLAADPLEEIQIANKRAALTFARSKDHQTLIVHSANAEGVTGANVAPADPEAAKNYDAITAYQTLGPAFLARYLGETITVPWDDLIEPVVTNAPHIAAGTNYLAHAEEVGMDGEPFLFPKLTDATAWNADVAHDTRLDYEVELCAVTLDDHRDGRRTPLGFMLCGDFTERWTLVRDLEFGAPMGTTGFPTGKGGPTKLPLGPLLVVPFEQTFYEGIELELYVNDALRQRANAGLMAWSPLEVLNRAIADCETDYANGEEALKIADCREIPARTMVLTGTPEGVMFSLANVWYGGAYLREGDVVTSVATHLGMMRNVIR